MKTRIVYQHGMFIVEKPIMFGLFWTNAIGLGGIYNDIGVEFTTIEAAREERDRIFHLDFNRKFLVEESL